MNSLLLFILLTVSPFQIDEVEVVAERTEPTDAFRVIAQINHDEIQSLPVSNIADILAYLPGIDVRSRGASSAQSDISVQGGTFDQMQVLLNGINISDAQTGHYTMNIPITPALIERIEILQGAINIVTRDSQTDRYTLQMSAGTNADVHPAFGGSWNRRDVHINTSAEYIGSNGYYAPQANEKEQQALQNTDFRIANIYLQTRWKGMDVQAGAQYKDAGLGTGYGYASTDQFDATRTVFVSAKQESYIGRQWSIMALMAYRGQYDRYEWHRGTVSNRHWTHNTQATLQANYTSVIGRTTLGAAFKDEFISSSNMGTHNRWQVTLNAEQNIRWRGLTASVGLAEQYNSWIGWNTFGNAHIGYEFARTGSIILSASRSLRIPTWTDLFYKAGVQRGNAELKAEKAWRLALKSQYTWLWEKAGSLHLAGEVYYRWGKDVIDWNYNETDSLYYATNQNTVNAFGIDLLATYRYNKWLRRLTVRYAYTTLSTDVTQTKSQYLDYLRHKVSLHLDHGIYVWDKGCIGADWSLRWQAREGAYVDIYGVPGNTFKPVLLLDGSLYAELPHIRVALECQNMTNRHYYDYGGILMPGIHGALSLQADF